MIHLLLPQPTFGGYEMNLNLCTEPEDASTQVKLFWLNDF